MQINPKNIFSIQSTVEFNNFALSVFKKQAKNCLIYKAFIDNLRIDVDKVNSIEKIPFLPVSFFKSHIIVSNEDPIQIKFSSSATTGTVQSTHAVTDLSIYERSYLQAFVQFYGDIQNYTLLALLPSYQEREGSSLIYMVDDLIKKSKNHLSGYFLDNNLELYKTLNLLKEQNKPTILIGVTYALLDFVEMFKVDFPELIVMETGGMKGKRPEIVREELHEVLCNGFNIQQIHSEYGMTELLSQAYSKGQGVFECPPWMQVLVRDINDPFTYIENGKTGGINVIDLANINSCSFISTQDLGKLDAVNKFTILGRFDNADIRGCNLLVQ